MSSRLLQLAVIASCLSLAACTGTRPNSLGNANTNLQSCPDSPNCVSSVDNTEDEEHFIKALDASNQSEPILKIASIIEADGGNIIIKTPTYIYAEFTSDLMHFVDDVEFLLIPQTNKIEVRSASRLGRSDFGVNRDRIELIRSAFQR